MREYPRSISAVAVLAVASVFACVSASVGGKPTPVYFALPAEGATISAKDFHDAVDANHGKHNDYQRDGTTCKKCVSVQIEAVGQTTNIDVNNPPPQDQVVAQIRNVDKDATSETKNYHVKHQSKADYYLWIPKSPSPTRWVLVELTKVPGNMLKAHQVDSGSLNACDQHEPLESDARFQSCPRVATAAPAIKRGDMGSGLQFTTLMALFPLQDTSREERGGEDPAWIRCSNGCCTAADARY